MYKLICISGINLGDEQELHEGETSMGRSMQNDICILDTKSSRYHAKLTCNSGNIELEDLNSTNGILVNNTAVAGKILLTAGDLICIGNTTYQMFSPNDTSVDMTNTANALLGAPSKENKELLEKTTFQITKTVTIAKTDISLSESSHLSFFDEE